MADFSYPKKSFDIDLQGYETFLQMLKKGEYNKVFRMKLRRKNKVLAVHGASHLSKEIRNGQFERNSPVTEFLKKSSKPLVNHADLLGSVSSKVGSNWYSFYVGVKRRTPSGKNLAHMLETGFTIKVTPKMRGLFWHWARESGGKVKALKLSTTHIRVKPRPYMRQAFFTDKSFQAVVQMGWKDVVHETFKYFAAKGKAEPIR